MSGGDDMLMVVVAGTMLRSILESEVRLAVKHVFPCDPLHKTVLTR